MRELEDEGKVMALADYAAPIADADNPLLPWVHVRYGIIHTEWPGHALRAPLARVHWRFPNEQFAYLAQRAVEHAMVALARDAVRLTGLPGSRSPAGVVFQRQSDAARVSSPKLRRSSCSPLGDGRARARFGGRRGGRRG